MKQYKNIYRIDKFITQDRSCLKTLRRLFLFLCQNSNIRVIEEVVPRLIGKQFSHAIRVSWNRLSKIHDKTK